MLPKEVQQPRSSWPMAGVVGTESDKNGIVRSIKLRIGNSKIYETFRRPISKLILLIGDLKNE